MRARAGGLRRAPDRRLQHDPRHQGGVDRARPRPARVRAVRLRRQRPAVRLRHGARRSASAASSCRRRRPVLVVRPALCRRRASLLAHLPPAAAPGRSRPRSTRLGRAGRRRRATQLAVEGFTGARARLRRSAALHYQGQSFELTVPVPDGPIDARDGRASRGGLRRASTSGPTAIAPGPRSRSSWSRSRSSARACARARACPSACAEPARARAAAAAPRLFRRRARLARDAGPAPLRSRDGRAAAR